MPQCLRHRDTQDARRIARRGLARDIPLLPDVSTSDHNAVMNHDLKTTLTAILANMPEWIRQELSSKEKTTRVRAEEALAAMVAGAVENIDAR
jgi:hypothetical protein